MSQSTLKDVIIESLKELEADGDIVISTTTPSTVIDKLVHAVTKVYPTTLTKDELAAIKNSVNVTCEGFKLDDEDFQTHIGLTKSELEVVLSKLNGSV
ncbi:hypothetical protein [Thalassotalea atypica]|uniref:hypothetical protein n=1 Tax=Thalassotalea atypica TaxID=2054316 RepID=UPI0025739208|nr:hypothetical protein [Thalassotalea atypica]